MNNVKLFMVSLCAFLPTLWAAEVPFSPQEQRIIQSLSGEHLKLSTDPTNKVSGNAQAIQLGRQLFFDVRLSGTGAHACASCHHPHMSFSSPLTRGKNNTVLDKHTPHLWNVGANRWYFWDGRADSLWSQALEPIENEHEMAGSRVAVARLIQHDADYLLQYEHLFAPLPAVLQQHTLPEQAKPMPDEPDHPANLAWERLPVEVQSAANEVLVNVLKAIAAFEETIVSKHSAFDRFAQALSVSDRAQPYMQPSETALSQSALRGLKLFIGKAGCVRCHSGANFTDGEFHHLFLNDAKASLNTGRYQGISQLMKSAFNSKSQYSDAPPEYRHPVDYVYRNVEFRGQYKTPTLRNVAKTAPYMHNGQFQTLAAVIAYYNTISEQIEPGNHQETTLQSLQLSDAEQQDLEAFLRSLTDESFVQQLSRGEQ